MLLLTTVAFSFSKWLLWEPDHWMISCKDRDRFRTVSLAVSLHTSLSTCLTSPRSSIKLSPWLKLSQLTGTSVALMMCRPLTCSRRWTSTSLVTTCLNPEATPPFCVRGSDVISAKHKNQSGDNYREDLWVKTRNDLCIYCSMSSILSAASTANNNY